jgi:hypothetical protein
MTPEEQEIVDRQAPVVQRILHGTINQGSNQATSATPVPPKPRRTRSDAGTKRPKPEQPAGKLSGQQIVEMDQLRDQMESDKFDYLKSQAAYYAFLDGIRAK